MIGARRSESVDGERFGEGVSEVGASVRDAFDDDVFELDDDVFDDDVLAAFDTSDDATFDPSGCARSAVGAPTSAIDSISRTITARAYLLTFRA